MKSYASQQGVFGVRLFQIGSCSLAILDFKPPNLDDSFQRQENNFIDYQYVKAK